MLCLITKFMMIYILSLAIISIFIQSYGLTYDFIHIIMMLLRMSRIIFTTWQCMMKICEKKIQDEVIQLFKLLKDMNFRMVCAFVTSTIGRLIECDLLFCNANENLITVQNHLLEKKIVFFLMICCRNAYNVCLTHKHK